MRLLFELDRRDYDPNGVPYVRHSARAIIWREGRVAMIYSREYDYYKFPGGGIEPGESYEEAMIRETREEAGLTVLPESVRAFGYVHRAEKCERPGADYFLQDNFYYLCDVADEVLPQLLDDYEAAEHFTLVWVTPEEAIRVNRTHPHGRVTTSMPEREAHVLELLRDMKKES